MFEHRSLAPPFPKGVPRHDHDLQRLVELRDLGREPLAHQRPGPLEPLPSLDRDNPGIGPDPPFPPLSKGGTQGGVRGGIWTPAEACTFLLGAKLKELVEQHNPLADSPSVFADLVASALDNVDWHEIAREFLGLSNPDPEPQFLERSFP